MHRAPPDGETGDELVARVREFLKAHSPSNGLLVCHAGPIRVLRSLARRSDAAPSPLHLDFETPVVPLTLETLIGQEVSVRP
jgi:broad specificity phosphatase PhoE